MIKAIKKSKFWDSSILVGIAIAFMIFSRFNGLGEPYVKAFDPYMFWRISDAIFENGAWFGPDSLRYYPFGWNSTELASAVPYSIVTLGHLAGNLKAAVKFYPAFFGLLSVVAMAFLGKKLGMSGIGSLLLAIVPAYMYRTSQGFADKEPLAFFFGILGWYFVSVALDEEKWLPAVYAGLSLGMISAVWGGKLLFIVSLMPLLGLFILREETKKAAILSSSFIPYVFLHLFTPRYGRIFSDPVNMGILLMGFVGIIIHLIYQIKVFKKLGKKRLWIIMILGGFLILLGSLIAFNNPLKIVNVFTGLYSDPFNSGKVTHYQTVAENQKTVWTWNLSGNSFWQQTGTFFFISLGLLMYPILTKIFEIIKKKNFEPMDYIYAGGLALSSIWLIMKFPHPTVILLFLLGLPKMLDKEKSLFGGWKTLFVLSIAMFGMFSGFSSVRLMSFAAIGIAFGAAYFIKLLLTMPTPSEKKIKWGLTVLSAFLVYASFKYFVKGFDMLSISLVLALGSLLYLQFVKKVNPVFSIGLFVAFFAIWQIGPSAFASAQSMAGTSLTTTWFENAKWMEFNVPHGEPMTTWWDYGYWLQTLGNTTSLGDGGNVGPGQILNKATGHFFATDDYENATAWADDWNLTYFTIDSAMLPKFWAYATLGGLSNVINQLKYQGQYPTDFGLMDIYPGYSDDYGSVVVGELLVDNSPVYLLGQIYGNSISKWLGYIDEFSYFSSKGVMACAPIGYCKSNGFGNLERLNQSVIVYPQQMAILGDESAMHSTFARLWFFEGYNTDFVPVLNNGETKTFIYVPNSV